jgi:hypothetical protein
MTTVNGHDPFAVNEDRALDALRLAWGDSYEIYVTDGQWQAWHDDAPDQDILTGTTPDELNRAIRADFARRISLDAPVQADLGAKPGTVIAGQESTAPGRPPMRDHDVTALTAGELERARRDLTASLALARPDSPARVPILAHLSAINTELAGRAAGRPDDCYQAPRRPDDPGGPSRATG